MQKDSFDQKEFFRSLQFMVSVYVCWRVEFSDFTLVGSGFHESFIINIFVFILSYCYLICVVNFGFTDDLIHVFHLGILWTTFKTPIGV